MNETLRRGGPETGGTKQAALHEMWRRRRGVIEHVREMPAWDHEDDVDVSTLGSAYNELRQKALHLARIVEKDMERHQQHVMGRRAQARKPMLRGEGGRGA